jgi:hypothetical protein
LAGPVPGVPDHVWEAAAEHFTDHQLVCLDLAIATINAWNRIMAATGQISGEWIEESGLWWSSELIHPNGTTPASRRHLAGEPARPRSPHRPTQVGRCRNWLASCPGAAVLPPSVDRYDDA